LYLHAKDLLQELTCISQAKVRVNWLVPMLKISKVLTCIFHEEDFLKAVFVWRSIEQ